MTEENNNIIQLQDENGNDINFEHIMTVENEGKYYVVLEALQSTDDCQEGEAIILRIERDEDADEDIYVTIEDEDEYNAVCDLLEEIDEEEDEFGTYEDEEEDK